MRVPVIVTATTVVTMPIMLTVMLTIMLLMMWTMISIVKDAAGSAVSW